MGSNRTMRKKTKLITASVISIYILSCLCGCGRWRRAEVTLIPAGYVGWVVIEYGVKGAPNLSTKYGDYIISVPSSGSFKTATSATGGVANDKYFYVTPNEERQQLEIAESKNDKTMI